VQPVAETAAPGLRFIAWSRIWSPLVPEELRREAWDALELPGRWEELETEFWSTFQVGVPAPPVPLLLHAALGVAGDAAREDWMRVMVHLGLRWDGRHLPPDHLGPACEILACAIEADENVLVGELCSRYLLGWCEVARAKLTETGSRLASLPERLERDLRTLVAG
jgi:TorA maturation chaperone TorD